jgi:hypothetical protein
MFLAIFLQLFAKDAGIGFCAISRKVLFSLFIPFLLSGITFLFCKRSFISLNSLGLILSITIRIKANMNKSVTIIMIGK